MKAFIRTATAASGVAIALLLAGCATPADNRAMAVAAPAQAGKQHPYSVGVATAGGAETSALGSTNIGNPELKAAIEKSIVDTRLFREVVQGQGGQYQLSVSVVQISKPTFGLDFTVSMEAGWSLVRMRDNQVILRKSITSSHTATMGDAFVGVRRLQLAVEGAARSNIQQGLAAIAALDLT